MKEFTRIKDYAKTLKDVSIASVTDYSFGVYPTQGRSGRNQKSIIVYNDLNIRIYDLNNLDEVETIENETVADLIKNLDIKIKELY